MFIDICIHVYLHIIYIYIYICDSVSYHIKFTLFVNNMSVLGLTIRVYVFIRFATVLTYVWLYGIKRTSSLYV